MTSLSRAGLCAALSCSILLSSAAATADPAAPLSVGAAFDLSPPTYMTSYSSILHVAAGTDGADFLVAWDAGQPYCARYTAAGALVDKDAIPIGVVPQSVTWDGHRYLIAGGGSARHFDPVTGALDPVFHLTNATVDNDMAVAAGGGVALDVWTTTQRTLSVSLTDAAGNIFADAVSIPGAAAVNNASAGFAGGRFLVAWTSSTSPGVVQAVRVSTAGVVEDSAPIVVDPGTSIVAADGGTQIAEVGTVSVAGSSSGFLVSWTDARSASAIYAARVGASGGVADVSGFRVGATSSMSWAPSAAWTGSAWWITWRGNGQAQGTTIGTDGSLTQPVALGAITSSFSVHAAAATSAARLGLWADGNAGPVLEGMRVDAAGTVLDAQPVALSSYLVPQGFTRVVASADGYAATWSDLSTQVLRFHADGTPIDPAPIPIPGASNIARGGAELGALSDQYFGAVDPKSYAAFRLFSVAANGSIGDAGAVQSLGTMGVALNSPYPLAVTCLADRCLVVWLEETGHDGVFGRVLDPSGAPLSDPIALGSSNDLSQIVASNDRASSFLVVNGERTYPIAKDGTLGAIGDLGGDASVEGPVQLVWGSDRYLLLQTTGKLTRLSSAGAVLGATESAPVPHDARNVRIGWDGRALIVFYTPDSGVGTEGVELPLAAPSTGGTPFVLSSSALLTRVASLKADSALFVGVTPEGPAGTSRAVAVRLGPASTLVDGGADGGDAATDAGADADAHEDDASADGGQDATVDASRDATADASAAPAGSGDGGGCGCTTAGGDGAAGPAAVLMGLAIAAMGSRRRRRER